jgi:hypothetical protein
LLPFLLPRMLPGGWFRHRISDPEASQSIISPAAPARGRAGSGFHRLVRLRPMLGALYAEHARAGDPIMRALGYEFPGDPVAAPVDDCFLLGPDILVAPVLETRRHRSRRLPSGRVLVASRRRGRPDPGRAMDPGRGRPRHDCRLLAVAGSFRATLGSGAS